MTKISVLALLILTTSSGFANVPVVYQPRPLSTIPLSRGDVPVYDYDAKTGIDWDHPRMHVYSEMDIQILAHAMFSAIDDFETMGANTPVTAQVHATKEKLADLISETVIEVAQGTGDLTKARHNWNTKLKLKLAAAYSETDFALSRLPGPATLISQSTYPNGRREFIPLERVRGFNYRFTYGAIGMRTKDIMDVRIDRGGHSAPEAAAARTKSTYDGAKDLFELLLQFSYVYPKLKEEFRAEHSKIAFESFEKLIDGIPAALKEWKFQDANLPAQDHKLADRMIDFSIQEVRHHALPQDIFEVVMSSSRASLIFEGYHPVHGFQADSFVFKDQAGKVLTWAQSEALPRTVEIKDLDVATDRNISTEMVVTRNSALIDGVKTHPEFIFQSARSHFAERVPLNLEFKNVRLDNAHAATLVDHMKRLLQVLYQRHEGGSPYGMDANVTANRTRELPSEIPLGSVSEAVFTDDDFSFEGPCTPTFHRGACHLAEMIQSALTTASHGDPHFFDLIRFNISLKEMAKVSGANPPIVRIEKLDLKIRDVQ